MSTVSLLPQPPLFFGVLNKIDAGVLNKIDAGVLNKIDTCRFPVVFVLARWT